MGIIGKMPFKIFKIQDTKRKGGNLKMKKIAFLLLASILVLGSVACGNTAAEGSSANKGGTVLVKKSGLTGIYIPPSPEVDGNLAINVDVLRGAMKSPGDPPPLVRLSLTNNTSGKIEIRKNPKSGQYGVQVLSEDKDGEPVDINAWNFMVETDLSPKVSWSVNVELISSLETKNFGVYVFYRK